MYNQFICGEYSRVELIRFIEDAKVVCKLHVNRSECSR